MSPSPCHNITTINMLPGHRANNHSQVPPANHRWKGGQTCTVTSKLSWCCCTVLPYGWIWCESGHIIAGQLQCTDSCSKYLCLLYGVWQHCKHPHSNAIIVHPISGISQERRRRYDGSSVKYRGVATLLHRVPKGVRAICQQLYHGSTDNMKMWMDYYDILTGQGCFRKYLNRFKEAESQPSVPKL